MSLHFLLTAKARTLSLGGVMRMSDDEAHARFEAIRFADNGGAAFCPYCECTKVYTYRARKIWKCAACGKQFSVTSGTIFSIRKLSIRDYLAAICIFVNAVKGIRLEFSLPDVTSDFRPRYAPPAPACPGTSVSPSVGSCRPSSRSRPPTTDGLPNVLAVFPGAISLVFLIGAFIAPETRRNPP
jgi:ribosomal protein L37AE/L43A